MSKLIKSWGVLVALALAAIVVSPSPAKAGGDTVVLESHDYSRDTIGVSRRFGIGVDVGWPFNGFNVNYFFTRKSSLQVSLGSNFGFGLKAEYLGYPVVLARGPVLSVPLYIGLGLGYTFNINGPANLFHSNFIVGSDILNAHVPLGVAFQLRRVPLDFFVQVEPGVDVQIVSGTTLASSKVFPSGRVGLGARWYF